uniref:E3 ubiquitin-protein ligase n=2 Tax=Amphimedon queenslandica TaxID=400682 RepID=A0A1X7TYN7_AMPQE
MAPNMYTIIDFILLVRRELLYLPPSPDIKGYWEWDSGHGVFLPYAVAASVDIELAHTKRFPSIDLAKCASNIPYYIDLKRQVQRRHGYGTERNIRRIPLSYSLQSYLIDQSKHSVLPTVSYVSPAATVIASSKTSTRGSSSSTKSKKKSSSPMITASSSSSCAPTVHPSSSTGKPLGHRETLAYKSGAVSSCHVETRSKLRKIQVTDDTLLTPLGPLKEFVKRVTSLNFGENGPCPICMNNLNEESGFEDDSTPSPSSTSSCDVCKLRKCGHMLHRSCLITYSKNSTDAKGCLRCPTCKVIHGVKRGDMPSTGTMTVSKKRYSLPGHPRCGTIEIVYSFQPGVQNGVHYRANGFPRTCYLPDSTKGQKVLQLLRVAWERRLTFTIGTSVTTGATNTIVWNEIHHKTESTSNHSGHGYPDENYLDNVLAELAAQGVTEREEGGGGGEGESSDDDL